MLELLETAVRKGFPGKQARGPVCLDYSGAMAWVAGAERSKKPLQHLQPNFRVASRVRNIVDQ